MDRHPKESVIRRLRERKLNLPYTAKLKTPYMIHVQNSPSCTINASIGSSMDGAVSETGCMRYPKHPSISAPMGKATLLFTLSPIMSLTAGSMFDGTTGRWSYKMIGCDCGDEFHQKLASVNTSC